MIEDRRMYTSSKKTLCLTTHPFCDGCEDMNPEVHNVYMGDGGIFNSEIKCKDYDKCTRIYKFINNFLSEKGDKENGDSNEM